MTKELNESMAKAGYLGLMRCIDIWLQKTDEDGVVDMVIRFKLAKPEKQ